MSYTVQEQDEFFKNIIKTKRFDGVEHCWLWHGKHNASGYGLFNTEISQLAHRFSYIIHKGKIPERYEIDHLCENRTCVYPNHLEAVPKSVNMRRIYDRTNTIQFLYDLSNVEHNIILDATPVLPRVLQCIKGIEKSWIETGMKKFNEDYSIDIGQRTIVDMFDIMLSKPDEFFTEVLLYKGEDYIDGYKRKWFCSLMQNYIDWYDNVSIREIIKYYTPQLKKIGWDRYDKDLWLSTNRLINILLDNNFTSSQQKREIIKEKEKELSKMYKELKEIPDIL